MHKELKQQKKNLESTYNTLRKILVQVDEQIQKLDDIKARMHAPDMPSVCTGGMREIGVCEVECHIAVAESAARRHF